MKKVLFAAAAITMTSLATASETTQRSDVEARLDALETINVTARKEARSDTEAPDAELDAILQAAASAESEATR